ncbi:MAG: DUF1707 domain-containing protein [Streptosporangiaceae bacterium]
MAGQYDIRVGDTERETTVNELREHFASGRLTQEEFNERVDQAFAAKTRSDLKAVMRDLPSVRTPVPAPSSDWGRDRSGPRPGHRFGAFAAVMTALWTAVLVFGVLDFGFGFGGSRPLGVVLFLAALAMLRRLVFGRGRSRGRAGGRCGRGGRRW